jgi:hypothetical protein
MDDAEARIAQANQLIDEEPGTSSLPGAFGRMERLCTTLSRNLPAAGVGVSVLTDDRQLGGTVAASDPVSWRLDELQFTLGEGPCIDAYQLRRPVLEPDLFGHGSSRWPGYAAAAQDEGFRAVFAFPLQIGTARAGAMDVYRREAGALSHQALSEALTFAEVAMQLLLDSQIAPRPGHGAELEDALAYRVEVYQAQGMVMVDLGVTLDEAMARLRAHAYAHERSLTDVARDVVDGSLRLSKDKP